MPPRIRVMVGCGRLREDPKAYKNPRHISLAVSYTSPDGSRSGTGAQSSMRMQGQNRSEQLIEAVVTCDHTKKASNQTCMVYGYTAHCEAEKQAN